MQAEPGKERSRPATRIDTMLVPDLAAILFCLQTINSATQSTLFRPPL